MTTPDVIDHQPAPTDFERPRPRSRERFYLAALVLLILLSVGLGSRLFFAQDPPTTGSAEAGFARDMQVHHAQAVEMALIIREKSTDPVLRAVAYDIATGQQQQSGQMFAWLRSWGLPQQGSAKAMAWMSTMKHSSMQGGGAMSSMKLLPDGRMPGMASPRDMQRLRDSSGQEAEVLFLQLMITHHKSGVMMAEAILQKTDVPQVRELAAAMKTSQQSEIRAMTDMLSERKQAVS